MSDQSNNSGGNGGGGNAGLAFIVGGVVVVLAIIAYFVFAGLIVWPQAATMTLGAGLGYFLGSHYAQKIPQKHVRLLVVLIGISLAAVFFWRQFLSH